MVKMPLRRSCPACVQYEGGEPCSVCGHVLAQPQQGGGAAPKVPSAFPTDVLPDFLYLGSYDHASRLELLKTLGINFILNVCLCCQLRWQPPSSALGDCLVAPPVSALEHRPLHSTA